jgi:dimethylaniline monooxygenase (N-oxide forming)
MSSSLKVLVIGAGVTGIIAANTMRQYGHNVTIYDKLEGFGGQWRSTYPGVTLQNTRYDYFFSGHPMPEHYELHPTGQQVLEYILNYAIEVEHLDKLAHFNREVVELNRVETKVIY